MNLKEILAKTAGCRGTISAKPQCEPEAEKIDLATVLHLYSNGELGDVLAANEYALIFSNGQVLVTIPVTEISFYDSDYDLDSWQEIWLCPSAKTAEKVMKERPTECFPYLPEIQ